MKEKIAVIINPNARKVKKGLYTERMLKHVFPYAEYFTTSNEEELKSALREIRDGNYILICGLGGDGTHHMILTNIVRIWENDVEYPAYLLLRGGTMNMGANNIPVRLNPVATMKNLRILLEEKTSLKELTREKIRKSSLIKVYNSEMGVTEYGFAISFGIGYSLTEAYYSQGEPSVQLAFNTVTSAIGNFIIGNKTGKNLLSHHRGSFYIDGEEYPYKTFLIAVASVFTKLVLWFKPFYARDGMWKEGFYFLVFSEPTWEAIKNIRALSLGKMVMKRSFNDIASKVVAELESGYTFDGEIFRPTSPYRVEIEKGPLFKFLRI